MINRFMYIGENFLLRAQEYDGSIPQSATLECLQERVKVHCEVGPFARVISRGSIEFLQDIQNEAKISAGDKLVFRNTIHNKVNIYTSHGSVEFYNAVNESVHIKAGSTAVFEKSIGSKCTIECKELAFFKAKINSDVTVYCDGAVICSDIVNKNFTLNCSGTVTFENDVGGNLNVICKGFPEFKANVIVPFKVNEKEYTSLLDYYDDVKKYKTKLALEEKLNEKKEHKKENNPPHYPYYSMSSSSSILQTINTPLENILKECRDDMRPYVESFKNKKTHQQIIAELKLTPAEQVLLEPLEDHVVTFKVPNIPVEVNNKVYDLYTVLDFENNLDPQRAKFAWKDVKPHNTTVTNFEKKIADIRRNREQQQIAPAQPAAQVRQEVVVCEAPKNEICAIF